MSVLRGVFRQVGVFGVVLLGALAVAGCEADSSTAASSASLSQSPLEVIANVEQTTVIDGTTTFTPQVQFEVKSRTSGQQDAALRFSVEAVPAVDWFEVDSDGILRFHSGQVGDYGSSLLDEVEDSGDGKAIAVTVIAVEPGRERATAAVTVDVVLRPFGLVVEPAVTYVVDGGSVLLDAVSSSPVNAHGEVRYLMSTSPAVDWLGVRQDGFLFLTGNASYAALETADDGDGKPVVVTITAEDTGRAISSMTTVSMTVRVLPPPFALTASPSTVTLASGSNRLNAANAIVVSLLEDAHLLGTAEYSLAGSSAELEWFSISSTGNTAVISLNQTLDYHQIDSAVAAGNKLIQLEVQMRDSGREASSLAEMVVDVVVTLTSVEEPLSLWPTRTLTSVSEGESTLFPAVSFLPNALGTMSYEVLSATSGTVDVKEWFAVEIAGQSGVLGFASVAGEMMAADYAALTDAVDLGGGKPVVVTVRGTDTGRTGSAEATVTVDVRASALSLVGNPATLSVVSGSSTLTPGTQGYTVENLIGLGRYTLAGTTPFANWFAIDGATGELSLMRPADYSSLPGASDGSDRTVTVTVQLMDVARQTDNVATTAIAVNVQTPTTLTLLANRSETEVSHQTQNLFPSIQFSTQGETDASAVSYTVDSVVPSGASWFGVTSTGALEMTSAADYSALGSVTALNGVKTVEVTVKATEGSDSDTLMVSVRVRPPATAFVLSANSSEAYVVSGTQTLDRAVTFIPSDTATYEVATAPSVDWFAVDAASGNLTLSSNADYDTSGLPEDQGAGRPITVTVTADSNGAKADASVVVHVLRAAPEVSIDPSTVDVMHGLSGSDIGATATATGVAGVRSYAVISDPLVDWFRVNPSTGAVSVRPDRAVDWNALPETTDAAGKKTLTLTIRLTDSRITFTSGNFQGNYQADATLTVNVNPAPLTLLPNKAASFLDHGLDEEVSTGIVIEPQGALGEVSYTLNQEPFRDWFAIDGITGDIRLKQGASLNYFDLPETSTTPRGRPMYITVVARETGRPPSPAATVIVYVKPPPLIVNASRTEVILKERAGIAEGQGLVVNVGNAVGEVSLRVNTSPNVDWFELAEREGQTYLRLKAEAEVDSSLLPGGSVDEEGRRALILYITATDDGRLNTPASATSAGVTIRVEPDDGPLVILNESETEFFEKSNTLTPVLRYEWRYAEEAPSLAKSGDFVLCDSQNICAGGFEWVPTEDGSAGELRVKHSNANFWTTKAQHDARGDDTRLPLYQRLILNFSQDGDNVSRYKDYVVVIKNVPNDERLTIPEGLSIAIPEGDANDPFFFPISPKVEMVNLSSDLFFVASIEIDLDGNDKFTMRDVAFTYWGPGDTRTPTVDGGEYGMHTLANVSYLGDCSFKPCRRPNCKTFASDADLRLALNPGETLTYDADAEPLEVSVRIEVLDGEPVTGTINIEVIQRQDGTAEHPFLVDSAEALASLADGYFSNDYTEAYCDILPSCRDGELASFQTQVSHYLQTDNIVLPASFTGEIGSLDSDASLAFHGTYDGGGYEITAADAVILGFFDRIGSAAVLRDLHLVEVDAQNNGIAGGMARRLNRQFSSQNESRYMSHRYSALTLPYFDFYFSSVWGNFDVRNGALKSPELVDVSVTGSVSGGFLAGGLVGYLRGGTILGSYSTASVTSLASTDASEAGGLVGQTLDSAVISQSFATGDVVAGSAAGGLVGNHGQTSVISSSFAAGVPSAESGTTPVLGALVGINDAIVRDSYGLGLAAAIGRSDGNASESRIYGSAGDTGGAGVFTSWTCASAPFRAVDLDGTDNGDCGTVGASTFPWDFGTSAQYPVPSANERMPAEIRALLPTP